MRKKKEYQYKIKNNLVYIKLFHKKRNVEKIVTIDLFNLENFLGHPYAWHLVWEEDIKNYYVKSSIYLGIVNGKPKYKLIYLHKFLANISDKDYGDHINNDSLDNRILNIRATNNQNNAKNRKNKNSNNKSGYRNVSWIKGYWRIQLSINKKNHLFPEKFTDVHLAGGFAKQMREKYYGEYSGKG